MRHTRSIAAASALVLAFAAPLPAAAAGTTPITWTPLPAVEPGQEISLYTNDLPALFAAQCSSGSAVQVSVGGLPVTAANLDWAILFTLPLSMRPGAQLVVSAPSCHASGSQVLTVATPIIAQATAQVVTQAGGRETATAGQPVTVTGTGFGVAEGPGFAVLLDGQPCGGCQIQGWNAGEIVVTLPQTLDTGAYSLSVSTSVGTSPTVPLYVLSVADAAALAAGKTVALPWASGSGRPGGGGSGRALPSGSGTRSPTGGGRDGGAGSPGGGGRSGHGAAGWQWPLLVGLGSLVAALAALAPWRRKRRAGAGQVQVEAPEPEPPAAEPEAEEQDPEGGDAP